MIHLRSTIQILFLAALMVGASLTAQQARGAGESAKIATYRLEIAITAPPEFLYYYLIDEEKIARWNKDESVSVSFPNGLEPRLGKRIKIVLDAPTHPWMLMEIRRLEPGREVMTQFIDGVLEGEFVYLLYPDGQGGSRLVHEIRIRPKGMLTTMVWELYGKHMHRVKMRAFMAKIKEVVERDFFTNPPATTAATPPATPPDLPK